MHASCTYVLYPALITVLDQVRHFQFQFSVSSNFWQLDLFQDFDLSGLRTPMKKYSVPACLKANSSLEDNAFHVLQNQTPHDT